VKQEGGEVSALHGKCLLLVEDDDDFRIVMSETLVDEGFEVIEARTGDEAVDRMQHLGKLDLLVTDIQIPGRLDGNGVATEAKRQRPGLPVVYISGRPESLTNRIDSVDSFVCKPFSSRHFVIEITRLLTSVTPV
jgi:CheY-like chemotaxis protein